MGSLLLVAVLGACHSKQQDQSVEEQMLRTQNEQISQLVDISKKQSDQITRLLAELEEERTAALEARNRPLQPMDQPHQPNTISGSAYIARASGGSSVVRDMQVLLLSNAQLRWNTCVKDGTFYSSGGYSDFKENQLRSDLAQFAGNVADLISAQGTTNADGKYKFQNIPAGDYFLFAQYSDAAATMCWFIPVKVMQEGAPIEVNLANSTAYATAYREVR